MKKIELKKLEGEENEWQFILKGIPEAEVYSYKPDKGFYGGDGHEHLTQRLKGIDCTDLPVKISLFSHEDIALNYGKIYSVWLDREGTNIKLSVYYWLNDDAYIQSDINPMKLRLKMAEHLGKKDVVERIDHLKEISEDDRSVMHSLSIEVGFKVEGSLYRKVISVMNMMRAAEKKAAAGMIKNINRKK